MREFFDGLDAGGVPREERVAAALGPKMLDLAAERSLGTHPYFTTPEHTAFARERVGPGVLVAPELAVVVETDAEVARAAAREFAKTYLRLRNYTSNLLRFGFTEDDIANGGSDRLIDAVIPHGVAGGDRRGRPRPPRRGRRPRVPPTARSRAGPGRRLPRAGEGVLKPRAGGPARGAVRAAARRRSRRLPPRARARPCPGGRTHPAAARGSSRSRAGAEDVGVAGHRATERCAQLVRRRERRAGPQRVDLGQPRAVGRDGRAVVRASARARSRR